MMINIKRMRREIVLRMVVRVVVIVAVWIEVQVGDRDCSIILVFKLGVSGCRSTEIF